MWKAPWGNGRFGRVLVATTAAVTLVTSFAGPVAANGEQTQFDDVRGHFAWTAWADSRPISPFFGIPFEFTLGAPFARSYLDSTPGRSEASASYYFADDTLEEVAELSGYKNPTLARCNFPDIGRGSEKEVAPAGPNGPRAWVKTPNRMEANAEARDGVATDALTGGSWARTKAVFDRQGRITAETAGVVAGLRLPNGATIGAIDSMVKVEQPVGSEPLISYRISLAGVQADGRELVGMGDKAITLAGTKVAGRELADQFNEQAKQHGGALQTMVAKLSLRLVEPRIEKHEDGGYAVAGPVFELRSDNTQRKNQTGDNIGLRLGYTRTYTWLVGVAADGARPAGETGTETTATGGGAGGQQQQEVILHRGMPALVSRPIPSTL